MLRLNRILDSEQITDILKTLFINRPIKIIRVIARSGRGGSSVPWVYLKNEITGDRVATFISFQDLLHNFWAWLETVKLLVIAHFQRQAISKVVWFFVNQGDRVYHRTLGWGIVVEKQLSVSSKIPRFWLDLEDRIEIIEPCFVEIF